MTKQQAEQAGAAVTLWNCIPQVVGSNLGPEAYVLNEVFHGYSQSLQAIFGLVSRSEKDYFLPNHFKLTINQSSYHSTLQPTVWDADGVIKQVTWKNKVYIRDLLTVSRHLYVTWASWTRSPSSNPVSRQGTYGSSVSLMDLCVDGHRIKSPSNFISLNL
jgi:hypothetical protein